LCDQNYEHLYNIFPASKNRRNRIKSAQSIPIYEEKKLKCPDETICKDHCCCCCKKCKPCPPAKKSLCCIKLIEHSTQLVPPAQKGTTTVHQELCAQIEKICDKVVIISGFIRKTISYKTYCDKENVIIDDIPFSCFISRDDIKTGDTFKIIKKEIICEVEPVEKAFKRTDNGQLYAFNLKEKDIIKICIEKDKSYCL
jgi:hypothetical protein